MIDIAQKGNWTGIVDAGVEIDNDDVNGAFEENVRLFKWFCRPDAVDIGSIPLSVFLEKDFSECEGMLTRIQPWELARVGFLKTGLALVS